MTFKLEQSLPYQQTKINVVYSTTKDSGNRLSIYKDNASNLCFEIQENDRSYTIKTPIFWSRNTWHRVMATWDFTKTRQGEMHLFVDGEEKVIATAGTFIAGTGYVAGALDPNLTTNLNISIKDQFQKLYVGANFQNGDIMHGKIDNLKISSKKKTPIYISGQAIDNDYTSNISNALPVVEDLYTTYLSNFNKEVARINDFTILRNKITGAFDFTIEIIDSFDIINDNARVKEILETLIKTLKPANTRAIIKHIR